MGELLRRFAWSIATLSVVLSPVSTPAHTIPDELHQKREMGGSPERAVTHRNVAQDFQQLKRCVCLSFDSCF